MKIKMTNSFISVVFWAFACTRGVAVAQADPPNVEKTPLTALAQELKGQFGQIRFHREEEFEDRFVAHGLPIADFRMLPRFYLIQSPRFVITSTYVSENVTSAVPTMYIATSTDGSKVYKLYGFTDAEMNFNRLVHETPAQTIRSTDDAEYRGLLCGEVVYGLSSSWWVADKSNAEILAAEHFFSKGQNDGLTAGAQWWQSIKGDRSVVKIHTTKNPDGTFSVYLPIFWAPLEGDSAPKIEIHRIEVGALGTCHMDNHPVESLK